MSCPLPVARCPFPELRALAFAAIERKTENWKLETGLRRRQCKTTRS